MPEPKKNLTPILSFSQERRPEEDKSTRGTRPYASIPRPSPQIHSPKPFPVLFAVRPPAPGGIMKSVGFHFPRKGKPAARRGRKATGLSSAARLDMAAGLPKGTVPFFSLGPIGPYSPHSLAARPGVARHAPSQPKLGKPAERRGRKATGLPSAAPHSKQRKAENGRRVAALHTLDGK